MQKPRVLLFSGKGGVGKTTIAAATGLACAHRGQRTLVLSLDIAHSLADAFDLDRDLADHGGGRPIEVGERLSIQEVDVQEELERYWGDILSYLAVLFRSTGFDEVVAEELAILPGMEDVVSLLYLNEYIRGERFDVIILDCAPTGESLRFVSMPSVLEWYMRRLFRLQRRTLQLARPLLKSVAPVPLPGDEYFAAVERLYQRLEGIDEVLQDPDRTSVRLVTNPEKMVIRETQRAHLYFCLYNMPVDEVIANRVFPDRGHDAFIDGWRTAQQAHLRRIEEIFAGTPVRTLPLLDGEAVGLGRLGEVADALYADGADPAAARPGRPPYRFEPSDLGYLLSIDLPFAARDEVDLYQHGDELIVNIGSFKRHVPLPRAAARCRVRSAQHRDGVLRVELERKNRDDHGREEKARREAVAR